MEFGLKADENARLYHEIVFANGKETYYYRGNPFEKGRNPRKAVWHVIGRDIRRPSTTRWSQEIVTQEMVTEPFKYRHEAFDEGKVYLVSDWNAKGSSKVPIRRGGVGLIYIPTGTGWEIGKEEDLVWLIDDYVVSDVELTFLPDWVASFVEYPLGGIRPSLNYPRGEFHG